MAQLKTLFDARAFFGVNTVRIVAVFCLWAGLATDAVATVKENPAQVRQWNRFADRLLSIHRLRARQYDVRTEEGVGGYADRPEFYREVTYTHANNGRLLSRVRWERERPNTLHEIQLFFYDGQGRVEREYSATYLPEFRNAPIQTLVNVYGYNDRLTALRQFDASGVRIFEHCQGRWFDEDVSIALDEPLIATPDSLLASEPYIACFGRLPVSTGNYLDLVSGQRTQHGPDALSTRSGASDDDLHERIATLSLKLRFAKSDAGLLLQRCRAHFDVQDFDKAIEDCDRAINADPKRDEALFWRGMARGRYGEFAAGIADLTLYIGRHPDSSLAYTKRGVRHIWNGDFEAAEKDLVRAIELNSANAEAHDDLGVLLAQRRDYAQAITHFETTIRLAPDYQKAHENLALVLHLAGQNDAALRAIENALALGTDMRSAVLLKGNILKALGREAEAGDWIARAESMPSRNWSETLTLRAE